MHYDSKNEFYKNPFGAVNINQKITFFVENDGKECYLVIKKDKKDYKYIFMYKTVKEGKTGFEVDFIPDEVCLYFYHFQINHEDFKKDYIFRENDKDYQLTVHYPYKVPEWFKNAVVYQIFPDRFYNPEKWPIDSKPNSFIYSSFDELPMNILDQNGDLVRQDFYGGNLQGVIDKLDYLHSLGITCIYFNPIFESNSCHRYNTKDYLKIDSMLGDEDTFIELVNKAENLGIKIILDGVFNHTGDDSKYFIKAQQSKESEYYDWYYFKNYPDDYESWWGFKTLPKVNCMNESYRNFIMNDSQNSVLNYWMNRGVKGWRLDVVDELTNEFVEEFKKKMRISDEESILIGEVWEDASNKEAYHIRRGYFNGKQLDSVMGYPFKENVQKFLNGEITGIDAIKKFISLQENYPREAFYSNLNLLSSHDTPRCITTLNNDKINFLSSVVIQMTFPGVPQIYYGDEVGLEGAMSPDCRRAFPWGKEDEDILIFYKKMINLRKKNDIFVNGDIMFYEIIDDIFSYMRYNDKGQKAIVIILRKDSLISIKLNTNLVYEYFENKTYNLKENLLELNLKKGYYIFSNIKLNI